MAVLDEDPIIVAPMPTPFDEDGKVDYGAIERNIARWLGTRLSGFVLTTANGEELALSEDERVEIVGVASWAAKYTTYEYDEEERFTIAGIDNPSTRETLRLADLYARAGADMVRVRVPRGLSDSAVMAYFGEVARRSPRRLVVIHQTFSGTPAASPETLGAVCELENVFGYITDHDIRFESYVRPYVPNDKRFWICNGGLLAYGALMGATGACMWLGNVAPGLCRDIMALGLQGRFAETVPLQAKASLLDRVIIKHGIAGVKAALDMLGFEGMTPRAPLEAVGEAGRIEIREAFAAAGVDVQLKIGLD